MGATRLDSRRGKGVPVLSWINYVLVYAGVAVMVYNIYGFIRYARYVQGQKAWRTSSTILYIPIALVILFLLGYLAVGLFGQPDLVIACILFGGSIFVAFMHQYLSSITHRIMENERLEAELMAAEKSNEAKASFLASMNHEMHTPLNVIMGMNDLALKNPALPPEVAEQLEKSNLSAKHLLGLIDNALDLNRIEAGMLAIANEEFSLADALAQVNAIAHASCAAKGLTYEPNAVQRKHCRVMGDETNLKRVLLSILDNAVKYTDAPGNVTFAAERVPAEDGTFLARFVVSDTGIGMDEEFIPRVFQAFSQEDAGPTTQYGGSGMSLAVAKSLIELMGGTIEVKSKKGQGTTFTVTVPFACVAEHDAPAEQPEGDPTEALDGARILIVEDTPRTRRSWPTSWSWKARRPSTPRTARWRSTWWPHRPSVTTTRSSWTCACRSWAGSRPRGASGRSSAPTPRPCPSSPSPPTRSRRTGRARSRRAWTPTWPSRPTPTCCTERWAPS